ncbi:MAG: ThiF family adenylyltransferase [Pyrinomonadaceae bacterium]
MIETQYISDNLSRTIKLAVDSGEAATLEEAAAIFEGYAIRIHVGPDVADSATLQATLLTAVNAARRCFLGGVEVVGCADVPLRVPLDNYVSLRDAVAGVGGHPQITSGKIMPEIVVGDVNTTVLTGDFGVRTTFEGWTGAVAPVADKLRLTEQTEFTPAGVLAGALAVSEAFQYVRGRNAYAGKRAVGLSLWDPSNSDFFSPNTYHGPALELLPSNLWIIGLGHLGQAVLWTLGFLPFSRPDEVRLVLQDTDKLVPANDSTSPLTDRSKLKQYKTRAMAAWAEGRGFTTMVVERLFANDFKINSDEPRLAICGIDNAIARRVVEDVGFDHVIEAGLGKGGEEYLAFQMHTFPGGKKAANTWTEFVKAPPDAEQAVPPSVPAYNALATSGFDNCGLTLLANRSVGAAFVGLFTSTLVIAEVLRRLAGGRAYDVIDGSLRDLSALTAVEKGKVGTFNPGYTHAVSNTRGASL